MTERPLAAVLGLGTVGGSLALALRASGRYESVVGWDPDFDVQRQAQRAKVVDRFARGPQEAVQRAAAVFIAVGAAHLRDVLTAAAPHLRVGAVICSVDEAHEATAAVAQVVLPANVSFVSVNPIVWEPVGPDTTPSPTLFQRGILSITPSSAAHPDAVAYVSDLAAALGMETYFVDAREHDSFYAGIGRLPAVLAAALLRVASRRPAWRELSRLAGGQFRQATEPAAVDPARQQEAMSAEREHLARWLDELSAELLTLKRALEDGQEPSDYLTAAADARAKWLHDRQTPAAVAELPRTDVEPRRLFWGSRPGKR